MRNELCKGCYGYTHTTSCGRQPTLNNLKCPCIDCLVKSMCVNACDKMETYINEQFKEGFWDGHKLS